MIGQVSIAAAAATIGTDLFRDQKWNVASQNRTLRGLAVCGSTAAGDCEVELFVGQKMVTNAFNKATGFPTKDHIDPLGEVFVPAGSKISCIVRVAAVANPINIALY